MTAIETVRRLRVERPCDVLVLAEHDDADIAGTARVFGGEYRHDHRDVVTALRRHARATDLIVLPVEPGRERVPRLGAQVARALPDNPLLIVVDGGSRSIDEISDDHVSTEHPFGPPPWARTT